MEKETTKDMAEGSEQRHENETFDANDPWAGPDLSDAALMGEDLVETGGGKDASGEGSSEAKDSEDASPRDEDAGKDVDEEKAAAEEDSSKDSEDENDKGAKEDDSEEESGKQAEEETRGEKTPPPGFVPLKALQEERERRKQAFEEALYWKNLAEGKTSEEKGLHKESGAPDEKPGRVNLPEELREDAKEFRRLYPEYAELLVEDSSDGELVRNRLGAFGPDGAFDAAQSITVRRELRDIKSNFQRLEQEKAREAEKAYILRCEQELAASVPGLYHDPEVAKSLVDFAVDAGINKDFLGILTDPGTRIVPAGQSPEKSMLLGEGATSLVKAIYSLKQKMEGSPKLETIRKEIEAELRPKITEEILNKVQKNPEYRGLDEVRSAKDSTPAFSRGLVSDKELEKMSPKELEAYLGGA